MIHSFQKYVDRMRLRYGLILPRFEDCVAIFGGVGMSQSDLASVANAVFRSHGDEEISLYELETNDLAFPPIDMKMNEESFRALKGMEMSHFDLLVVPQSKKWAMALTTDLEAIVYGDSKLVDLIRSSTQASGGNPES